MRDRRDYSRRAARWCLLQQTRGLSARRTMEPRSRGSMRSTDDGTAAGSHGSLHRSLVARTMAVMAGPWSLDKLAAVAGETEARLRGYADAGLLHVQPDGDLEPDSLHRVRLIQFARSSGVTDDQLAAGIASQGDLLRIFDELAPVSEADVSLVDTAHEVGLDDGVISELAEIMDWDDAGG